MLILPLMTLFGGAFTTYTEKDVLPFQHKIIGFFPYDGDTGTQEFAGDLAAELENGSQWKFHIKDTELVSHWTSGDVITIDFRDTWYWFKREHKFLMRNITRNESARSMLLKSPLTITACTKEPYHTTVTLTNTGINHSDYRVNVTLSDKSNWEVLTNEHIKVGTQVFIGYRGEKKKIFFFAHGEGKNAKKSDARKGNYRWF